MTDAGPIDVGQLLTIDVGSELRKLSQAQLQGPWQIPAEIARRALRGGASRVRIETSRHAITITDEGTPIARRVLKATAALMQPGQTNETRHAALTALEQAGGLALLAVAGLQRKQLRIEVHCEEGVFLLEANDKGARLSKQAPSGARRNTVRVSSPEFDRKQIRDWLSSVGRFSGGRIVVDGAPLDSGWKEMLLHGPLVAPAPSGRVGLPREGETAHVWLLEHGVITGHLTAPDSPCFEAAIELGSDATDLSAARLRDEASPHISHIVAGAVRLACEVGVRGIRVAEPQRARLARLLLAAARRRIEVEQVAQVRMFRVIQSGETGLASLVQLRSACQSGGAAPTLLALYPSQNPADFAAGEKLILIADATERSGLAEVLNLRFRPPNPKESGRSMGGIVRGWVDEAGRTARHVVARMRHPMGAKRVDPSAYTAAEQAFVDATRPHLNGGRDTPSDLALCAGAGPIRTSGRAADLLLLPRKNPTVAAAVAAVATDPAWSYPALLALLGGRALPTSASRTTWRRRLD
ncbi:MAG: hypothetical protein AAGA54_07825 [Myxococcota bacterium]